MSYAEKSIDLVLSYGPFDAARSRLDILSLRPGADFAILDPPVHGSAALPAELADSVLPVPDDFHAHLQTMDALEVGPELPAALGGLSGVQYDVVVKEIRPVESCFRSNFCSFVLLWEPKSSLGTTADLPGQRLHIWWLEGRHGPIVVVLFVNDAEFVNDPTGATQSLLASLRFH